MISAGNSLSWKMLTSGCSGINIQLFYNFVNIVFKKLIPDNPVFLKFFPGKCQYHFTGYFNARWL